MRLKGQCGPIHTLLQYLIDLLNIIKTKSDTLTLSRREGDFEPLMLEAKEVLGVLMPMNPKR